MGSIASYLQAEMPRCCPAGWSCSPEELLLPAELAQLLGYAPRADVVLSHPESGTRLWLEFEVSRADPVANHAKFATAHLLRPFSPSDTFIAMVSPHVDRGRRNLAAGAIRLMRRIGMRAFQTFLLPGFAPSAIQRLNQTPIGDLPPSAINARVELERAIEISTSVVRREAMDVHLVGDLLDAYLNLRGWNEDMRTEEGRRIWGCRAVSYFVFDPVSEAFAPSKFCAYTPVDASEAMGRMTVPLYASLNDGTHVMDGNRAWRHLVSNLAMTVVSLDEIASVRVSFQRWLELYRTEITVRGDTFILLPPTWYARQRGQH